MTTRPDSAGPRVSVAIPVFNRAGSVGAAIDSVLAQDPAPFEVIVVDDGSTDATPAVLAGYGDRIVAISQANAGAAAARNAAMARARGDWIAFLDSDDLWYPGRLAALARDLAGADPAIGLHLGDIRLTGPGFDTGLFALRGWRAPAGGAARIEGAAALSRAMSGMPLQSAAVRRDWALAEGGFPTAMRIYEDVAFFCDMALKGPWLITGDILAELRRLAGDGAALSGIERRRPVEAATARAACLTGLLARDLDGQARALVRARASGALFRLAAAEAGAGDAAAARAHLAEAVATHPSRPRAWLKALAPRLLGRAGYRLALGAGPALRRS